MRRSKSTILIHHFHSRLICSQHMHIWRECSCVKPGAVTRNRYPSCTRGCNLHRIIRRPPPPPPMECFSHGLGTAANQASRQVTNWPARAAQMISWPARAALYKGQQGIDKLARSSRAPKRGQIEQKGKRSAGLLGPRAITGENWAERQ